jgi:hypothetical protein
VQAANHRKPRAASPSVDEKKRRQRLKEVEERIALLETELAVLGRKLEAPPSDLALVQKMGIAYAEQHQELDRLLEEWETLQSLGSG